MKRIIYLICHSCVRIEWQNIDSGSLCAFTVWCDEKNPALKSSRVWKTTVRVLRVENSPKLDGGWRKVRSFDVRLKPFCCVNKVSQIFEYTFPSSRSKGVAPASRKIVIFRWDVYKLFTKDNFPFEGWKIYSQFYFFGVSEPGDEE